jgi:hypothetical protein
MIPCRDRAPEESGGVVLARRRALRARARDGKVVGTKGERSIGAELLARHYRQLRTSHGTVLLGDPPSRREAPRLDPTWFVTGCPLDVENALDVLRRRHGFASRSALLRALRKAQGELRAAKHADARALDDLPAESRRP